MLRSLEYELNKLERLCLSGRGEDFVKDSFVVPLFKLLGYDHNKDYEVIRPGDNPKAFILRQVSVKRGAKKSKCIDPDYIPTMRKKCFWIIEAKTAVERYDTFPDNYVMQGLQYCVNPEIRAKYLMLSNGWITCVYETYSRLYYGDDQYEPILVLRQNELRANWDELHKLLSVDNIREKIEDDLIDLYDKLVSSSLDKNYPASMLSRFEATCKKAEATIKENIIRLNGEHFERLLRQHHKNGITSSPDDLYELMATPLSFGAPYGEYFVDRCIDENKTKSELFIKLTTDYDKQSYFRKENTIAALCALLSHNMESHVDDRIILFLKNIWGCELPLLNQVETACVRIIRKFNIMNLYPALRKQIECDLSNVPETIRFVSPPTPLSETYHDEVIHHMGIFLSIVDYSEDRLFNMQKDLRLLEESIEEKYNTVVKNRNPFEMQLPDPACLGLPSQTAFENIILRMLEKKSINIGEPFTMPGLISLSLSRGIDLYGMHNEEDILCMNAALINKLEAQAKNKETSSAL